MSDAPKPVCPLCSGDGCGFCRAVDAMAPAVPLAPMIVAIEARAFIFAQACQLVGAGLSGAEVRRAVAEVAQDDGLWATLERALPGMMNVASRAVDESDDAPERLS